MKWFRFYHEFMDDPKIAMMSDSDQLLWVKALCLASDSTIRGIILLTDEEICWKLRITVETWKHAIDKFRAKGMIQHNTDGPGYVISNWDKRQFESDSSAERVRKHRAAKAGKQAPKVDTSISTDTETVEDEHCNVTVTPSEQSIPEQSIRIPEQSVLKAHPVAIKRSMLLDKFAMQFQQFPWKPNGKLDKDFCVYVGKVISFDPKSESMNHEQKGRSHLLNLLKTGIPEDFEKLEGYWDDYQQSLEKKAIGAVAAIVAPAPADPPPDAAWFEEMRKKALGVS
jgi:hypothetical protein